FAPSKRNGVEKAHSEMNTISERKKHFTVLGDSSNVKLIFAAQKPKFFRQVAPELQKTAPNEVRGCFM
ncbi:MAG: hypothetical protein LUD79_05265, partial [Oscillospiraceae bacterium]|nr:hypothetical protein [Oscillospiraceae bacterium]